MGDLDFPQETELAESLLKTTSVASSELHPRDAYRLLISVVVPRPIGWISTIGADGTLNLAPFSFFNAVSGRPPVVMFSANLRQGKEKDTSRNIRETGEFVVNVVDEALAEAMNQSSGEWPYSVNEFELAGLPIAPSTDVKPPRVAIAPVAMEARVSQVVPVEGTSSTIVMGLVVRFHFRDGLLRPDGTVDPELLRPVARLSRDDYSTLGRIFLMPRPGSEEPS